MTLTVIVWSSIALAVLSVLAMAGLILRRLRINRRDRILSERRDALMSLMTLYLGGSADDSEIRAFGGRVSLRVLDDVARCVVEGRCSRRQLRADLDLLYEVVQDLVSTVRGQDRARIVSLLGQTKARDVSLDDLDDRNPARRIRAAEMLALMPDAEVIDALHRKLDDPEPHVRIAAASALVATDDRLTVDELVEKLEIGVTVRSQALRHIFVHLAARDGAAVLRLLERRPSELVQALAIHGLGATQDYAVTDAIARCMDSPSASVRAEAMRALAAIGHPRAAPAVLKGLTDDAWEVRTEAAICAGRIQLTEAAGLLRERLADASWWARFRAAEALMAIGEPGRLVLEEARHGRDRAARISDMVLTEAKAAA